MRRRRFMNITPAAGRDVTSIRMMGEEPGADQQLVEDEIGVIGPQVGRYKSLGPDIDAEGWRQKYSSPFILPENPPTWYRGPWRQNFIRGERRFQPSLRTPPTTWEKMWMPEIPTSATARTILSGGFGAPPASRPGQHIVDALNQKEGDFYSPRMLTRFRLGDVTRTARFALDEWMTILRIVDVLKKNPGIGLEKTVWYDNLRYYVLQAVDMLEAFLAVRTGWETVNEVKGLPEVETKFLAELNKGSPDLSREFGFGQDATAANSALQELTKPKDTFNYAAMVGIALGVYLLSKMWSK